MRSMEHTNSIQPDRNERQPNRIQAIFQLDMSELHMCSMRCLMLDHLDLRGWNSVLSHLQGRSSSTGDLVARDLRSIREAILEAFTYYHSHTIRLLDLLFTSYRLQSMLTSPGSQQQYVDASKLDSELAIACTLHAFLTSVFHLLTSVFQYLIGYVDRGGSKTYSSGAFDFRASFVSLVLFQGAYVWIQFRQAARPGCRKRKVPHVEHKVVDIETGNLKGVYARPIKKKSSGAITRFKYEPRFTPPQPKGENGNDLGSKRLPLGEYHTRAEADIVLQIARYYYGKDGDCVELEDGRYKFLIPAMSEQNQGLTGKEKRKWVTCTAKQVGKQMYADFQREKGKHLAMATEAGSLGTEFNDPSSSALPLACSSVPMLSAMVDESAIESASPSTPSLPLLPFDGAIVGDADDSRESLSGFEDMIDELFYNPGLPNFPDHQSSVVSYQMHFQGFAQLLGDPSLLEVGGVPGGIEHDSEPELNPSPSFQQGRDVADAGTENIDGRIFLQQNDPVLQELVFCQKCLEDNARQFVPLDQLKAYQIQNSRLQQENERFRIENETLKSRLQQVASLSCNLDWNHDGHSTERLNDLGFFEK